MGEKAKCDSFLQNSMEELQDAVNLRPGETMSREMQPEGTHNPQRGKLPDEKQKFIEAGEIVPLWKE